MSSEIPFNPFIVRSGRVLRVFEEKTDPLETVLDSKDPLLTAEVVGLGGGRFRSGQFGRVGRFCGLFGQP